MEKRYFDEIQVNFLIVGHTHGPIDQYFSTRSKIRKSTHFIGSPLSLQNLFHDHQCLVSRVITVLHDWKAWLKPVINKKLKYHSIPHVFIFKLEPIFNRAICQFKQFSLESLPWLPIPPPAISFTNEVEKDIEFEKAVDNTNSTFLSKKLLSNICAGGLEKLVSYAVMNENRLQESVTMTSIIEVDSDTTYKADVLHKLMPNLCEIERRSICETERLFEKQCDDELDCCDRFRPVTDDLVSIENLMKKSSTEEFGFVIWLNLKKNLTFLESSPCLIDHYTNVSSFF